MVRQMPLSPITAAEQPQAQSKKALQLPLDPLLTLAVIGLGVCSVVTLRAVTAENVTGDPHYYVYRQAAYLVIGTICMLGLSRLDYGRLRHLSRGLYVLLIVLILAVFAVGHKVSGSVASTREIQLPLFSVQASELGKVLLIVALSGFLVERARHLRDRQTTIRLMVAALIPAMLVIVQPDLGSALVYIAIAFMLLFIAGTSWKHFVALLALGAVSIALVAGVAPALGVRVIQPYQTERLTAFLHPSNTRKQGYQQHQSEVAIGEGQKTGRPQSTTEVPERETDFIFASVGERYGFVGAALVLSLYALLIWRSLRILTMSKDLFGALIAGGVVAMMMFQVFVNVGVAIGILPITGITLPLMSYGGSSVITTLLAVGLLQSIYVRGHASEAVKGRVAL
jgi:rod shape determining protein RodA